MPDTTSKIFTLGRFRISVDGKTVATGWPAEIAKELFCSLLSPLDLYCTWDRICRAIIGETETRTSRRQLDIHIRLLNTFLFKELGFNPIITGNEGIKIDQRHIYVDAFDFNSTALEGLRLLSLGNHAAALDKFNRAKSIYAGSYLPGMSGKIIENTRKDLESLYRTTIMQTEGTMLIC
jgi:two-component SAPR family response regulator